MTLRIFISHSHKDAAWCDTFVDRLASYDVDIWYDRKGLYAGSQWVRTIEDELMSRDVFLIILTPDAWASEWVREELALAFAAKKRIIGIMAKQTAVTGFIVQRQMIDVAGKNAAGAAQVVAANLSMHAKAREPEVKRAAPAVTTRDLTGIWHSDFESWVFDIKQSGARISGRAAIGESGLAYGVPITGSVRGDDVTFAFNITSEIHDTYRLRVVLGLLVGREVASNYPEGTGFEVTLQRR